MSGRERLSSRLGFILLSAGCAIGIGNVWRFPYVAGQCGGGWFVILYLVFLALLGIPVLVMEYSAGRAAQRSIATLHSVLTPGRRLWSVHGILGTLGLVAIVMFYTTVTGWMLLYFVRYLTGGDTGFEKMLADPVEQSVAMLFVCEVAFGICAVGLNRGLERVSKFMMSALFLLIVVLAAHSVMLKGGWDGVRFFLVPDFARMRSVGFATVIVNAMNQAFFTLSLGVGSMAIFGSYIGKNRSLLGEAVNVTALDTFVAIASGLIVIPACFAFGIQPEQGPCLLFVTLPKVFAGMSGGRFWGALFFLFMAFAAFTTVLAVFEGIIASVREYTGWGRGKACAVLSVVIPLLSVPCVLGFNAWKGFQPLGEGTNVLSLEDFMVSNILLPVGSFLFAVYCTSPCGWGWKRFVAEANAGSGLKVPEWLRGYMTFVVPIIVLIVLLLGLR